MRVVAGRWLLLLMSNEALPLLPPSPLLLAPWGMLGDGGVWHGLAWSARTPRKDGAAYRLRGGVRPCLGQPSTSWPNGLSQGVIYALQFDGAMQGMNVTTLEN